MLVLITLVLALIPAVAILAPFLRPQRFDEILVDEAAPGDELRRRWDNAVAGLKSAELERALGTLSEDDFHWFREQYMTEAALVIKALELEQQQEEEMVASIEAEIRGVRQRVLGEDSPGGKGDTSNESTDVG